MQQYQPQSVWGPQVSPSELASRLLVSVQDPAEAKLARELSVGWIDLKQPAAGSLGAPSLAVARSVGEVLRDVQQKSIALGELVDLHVTADAVEPRQLVGWGLAEVYPVAKIGLAHTASRANWESEFSALAQALLPTKLVPVLYADGERCGAPAAAAVLELARCTTAPFILVDTYVKDGRRLLDWLTLEQLGDFIQRAEQTGARVVLAGSLCATDVPSLVALRPAALAVRGAVCNGERTASLCAERIKAWVQLMATGVERHAQNSNFAS